MSERTLDPITESDQEDFLDFRLFLDFNPFMKRTRKIDEENGISENIGIRRYEDKILVWCYLAQRLVRIDISNLNQKLEYPPGWYSPILTVFHLMKYQGSKPQWEKELRESQSSLRYLELQTNEYIENIYSKISDAYQPRAIELAINDLVWGVTSSYQREFVDFRPKQQVLRNWGNQWIDRIRTYNQTARNNK